ncbi:6-hydroxymethylpterin diphosphokinase MptE-like protein [Sporofaciens sp. JLR.KK001]|uniref:6-hydroxymethylpterin diphosphokinase MptE-like protein n=1 Tax=Sporofaciens sp. JLR.KK001 TaxID=3112621 RepID=UPI002FF3E571
MKKLYIWGAGEIGTRVYNHLDDTWEIMFVDSNTQLSESYRCGKKIIDIAEYLAKHSDEFVLIAHLCEHESIKTLKDNNIINFFTHCDLPGEFKEPYIRDDFKKYIINYLNSRTNYILYGLNIYSIIVQDWIYKKYGHHPYILIQDYITKEYVDRIKQQYKGLKLVTNIKELDDIDEVCISTNEYSELKSSNIFSGYYVSDIYDCSDKIDSYYNPAIEKFHNLHKGQRCFIVATGPSLKIEDLDLLKNNNEVCFSMNTIFYAFDKTDWRPDYYVVSDYRGIDEYSRLLDNLPVRYQFLGDGSETFWKVPHRENLLRFHQHYEFSFNRLPKFSDNFSLRSYMGGTVTYTCMQLAVYMGFTEIYLLGVDFSYGGNKSGKKYAHFHEEKELEATGFAQYDGSAYKAAEVYTKKHGIKIYNATRGGKLEVFERVNFVNLFNKL